MPNVLHRALHSDDLDAALKLVMDALEIKTGDVAGQMFGKEEREAWPSEPLGSRSGMLSAWLRAESLDCAIAVSLADTRAAVDGFVHALLTPPKTGGG